MSPFLAYGLGLVTLPAVAAVVLLVASGMERGVEIECRACGYSTGAMRKTRRITCHVRWRWHRTATGHHTRRWLRAQRRQGVQV